MAINLVTKVEPKIMERLYKESVTQGLFSNQFTWSGARTIEVMSVDNVPLTAYDRTLKDGSATGTIGNRFGAITELGDTKVSYTMQDEVKYNLGFEKSTNSDQNDIKTASSIISRQDREIVRPYLDKYRLNKLALGAGLNKYSATTTTTGDLSRSKILETLMLAKAQLANNYAPANQQVLYIGESRAVELKLAEQVIGVDKIAEAPIVNGTLGKIAGMQTAFVPDAYLPDGLAFLIVTKGSAWAPVKVKTARVLDEVPSFDGTLVQFHMYHDCFVNAARKNTIFACWTTAAPGA